MHGTFKDFWFKSFSTSEQEDNNSQELVGTDAEITLMAQRQDVLHFTVLLHQVWLLQLFQKTTLMLNSWLVIL